MSNQRMEILVKEWRSQEWHNPYSCVIPYRSRAQAFGSQKEKSCHRVITSRVQAWDVGAPPSECQPPAWRLVGVTRPCSSAGGTTVHRALGKHLAHGDLDVGKNRLFCW